MPVINEPVDDVFWVEVQLDKPRRLRFTLEAIHQMEEDLGGPLAPRGGIGKVRAMLRAALMHQDKRITLNDAMRLMEKAPGSNYTEKLKYLDEKLNQAYELAMGREHIEEVKKKLKDANLLPSLISGETFAARESGT